MEVGSVFLGGRASVRKAGKWGYINPAGEQVVDPEYLSTFGFTEGLAAVVVADGAATKAGYIDAKGKNVIKPQFDDAAQFSEGLAAVKVGRNPAVSTGPGRW